MELSKADYRPPASVGYGAIEKGLRKGDDLGHNLKKVFNFRHFGRFRAF